MAPTPKRQLVRAAYRKRKADGRCVRCGKATAGRLTLCDEHRQARAAYLRKRYREMSNAFKASRGD